MDRLHVIALVTIAAALGTPVASAQSATPEGSASSSAEGSVTRVSDQRSETAASPTGSQEDRGATLPSLSESLRGIARAEYEAAKILYEDGDYRGALTKLQVAYDHSQDPRLLWNMAAAHKNLRHYARVIELIEKYLAADERYVTEEDRQRAQALLRTVRGFVSAVQMNVQPVGATVKVDGKVVGKAPLPSPLVLDFGLRQLEVTRHGYVSWQQQVDLKGGENRSFDVTLEREINQGVLKVVTDPDATIRVDGKIMGVGLWQGDLEAGVHTVQIEASGKVPVSTEIVVARGEARVVNQALRDEAQSRKRVPAWAWIAGGVVTAAAVGTGTFLAVRGGESAPAVKQGTMGTLEF